MIRQPIQQITIHDIQALIGRVKESKTIEYKSMLPTGARDEKLKLVATLSSFANTAGGDLLIGLVAKEGVPTEATGISIADTNSEKLRLTPILFT